MYKIQITDTESNLMITTEGEIAAITTMKDCKLHTITINKDGYVVNDTITRNKGAET